MTMGALWFVIYCDYALGILIIVFDKFIISAFYLVMIGFWYGAKLIREGENSMGDLITVSGSGDLSHVVTVNLKYCPTMILLM